MLYLYAMIAACMSLYVAIEFLGYAIADVRRGRIGSVTRMRLVLNASVVVLLAGLMWPWLLYRLVREHRQQTYLQRHEEF